MNKFLAPVLAVSLAISASTAYAGGPVVVIEEPEVMAEKPASSSGAILPLILVGIALCVALCGSDDDEPVAAAPPPVGP